MATKTDGTQEYLAAMTAELASIAQNAGLPFLAYLLQLAQTEASGRATIIAKSRRVRTPGRADDKARSSVRSTRL